jgi:hypothetical protein
VRLACPHYTAELVLYAGLVLLLGGAHWCGSVPYVSLQFRQRSICIFASPCTLRVPWLTWFTSLLTVFVWWQVDRADGPRVYGSQPQLLRCRGQARCNHHAALGSLLHQLYYNMRKGT